MRKIEQQMLEAIKAKKDFVSGNTAVYFISAAESGNPYGSRSEVYLHGNHIADYWHETGEIDVNLRTWKEWPSNTTRSRLRALGANVYVKNGKPYYNDAVVEIAK